MIPTQSDSSPRSKIRRRRFIASFGGVASGAMLAGCSSEGDDRATNGVSGTAPSPSQSKATSDSVESQSETQKHWDVDPLEHEKLIGAHYYSWYQIATRDDWLQLTVDEPVLGEYASTDTEIVNQHIKWALEYGINWFNITWRPDSGTEHALDNFYLEAELADEISYSLQYGEIAAGVDPSNIERGDNTLTSTETESGRLAVDFDRQENRDALRNHFQRMEDKYFEDQNYLRINGRPLVYVYSALPVTGAANEAYAEAREAIDSEPYLVAELLGDGLLGPLNNVKHDWLNQFDAACEYGLYARRAADGDYDEYVDYAERVTTEWMLSTNEVDLDFIPEVMPGSDHSNIPDAPDNREPIERDADGFRKLCGVVRDRMDPDIDAIIVNSFNEWPEYSAIEPSKSYGTTYLEIVADELAEADISRINPESYPHFQIRYSRTISPAQNPYVEFGMALDAIELLDDARQTVSTYDVGITGEEPYLVEGLYPPQDTSGNPDAPLDFFRWAGGPTRQSTIYFPPTDTDATSAEIVGRAPGFAVEPIRADIYVDNQQTDQIELGPEPKRYSISLSV